MPEYKPNILDRMMVIDIKIAVRFHREVDERMLLEKIKHVIEETDACINCTFP
jgi:hypothetical protein